ncbi:hypothetical protein ABB37_02285 [Leptomonas pyrrhocoris]|uniref:MSP domain-containing protein n=1 Tax=Leptomonas pyrrhocoris TaxID=157538 RepID=A0A0N1J585_LEPPY|nr:hypothetical protein ABB37_02285 [Leptomonas pyrrhocoris]KPA84241.1 hypothetical protein ABB37_02285 [Leptomonas pyrrhocoris]|eukprot:XP_015662680.1 hypothetical protein ABB37_02285 [Leptomonas pyrrhocoris]
MAAGALQMKLSQDSLFFPLPFTNATIDNVVQIHNLLPVVPGKPKANVVSFKILSEVQHRYSVRPPVGFIGADDHITIVFSFNPEQVKAAKNPADRELPTEATRDAIHIDFAVVDADSIDAALAHWVPGSKESKLARDVMTDASAFWKKRGQVTKNNATMLRFKLRCVFAPRHTVPDSLVISMKEGEGKGVDPKKAAEVNAAVPKTRPTPTSTTDPRSTAPPAVPPHRHSETPRESTPRNELSPTARALTPPNATATAATLAATKAAAAAAAAPTARSVPVAAPPTSSMPAVRLPSSRSAEETKKKKGFVGAVLNYKLSYAVVAVLLVLTFFCGLWDHGNLLTWMISQ